MLQTTLLLVAASFVASLVLVQCRLVLGGTIERVVAHIRATIVSAAALIAVMASYYALASDRSLSRGLGLLTVGLSPESAARLALVRAMLWGMGGFSLVVALVMWRLPIPHRWLVAVRDDLAALVERVRADVHAARTDPGVSGLSSRVLLGLLVAGGFVRAYRATHPMSPDESITVVWFASRSPLDIISDYTIPNNHILHSLLVRLSQALFGSSELATRLPALLAGIALVAVLAWLAFKLFGSGPALAAAAFAAAAPPFIEYSAQARGYTLSACLLALAMVFLLYGQEDPRIRSPWVIYTACIVAALVTVPSSMMGVYFLGFWFLATYERDVATIRRPLAWTAAAGVITALLYVPAALRTGWRSVVANPYVAYEPWPVIQRRLLELVEQVRECWAGGLPGWIAILLAAATLWGVASRGRGRHRGAAIALGLLGTMTFVVVVNRVVPPTRVLLSLLPFVVLLAAAGAHAWTTPLAARFPRLPALAMATAALAWIGMLEVGARQRTLRPESAHWNDVGDESVRCCAEGYYPDAKAVAAFAKRVASERAPVAMQAFEGGSEAVRFYALGLGVPITRIHRFDLRVGVAQLAGYDSVFLVSRGAPRDTSSLKHAAEVLLVPVEQLRGAAEAHFIEDALPGSTVQVLTILPKARETLVARRKPFDPLEYPRAN